MQIKKSVFSTLKRHNKNNNLEDYEKYFKKCLDEYSVSDVSEDGDNLLSVYIKTKITFDLKIIDTMYKKGYILQEPVLEHPNFEAYINIIFRNKQKNRLPYFDQTDLDNEKRLTTYMSVMTNHRLDFFNYYNTPENIGYLKKQNLLQILFKDLSSCLSYDLKKGEESNKIIIENLVSENADIMKMCDFNLPTNIYDFGMLYIMKTCPSYYMQTYSIKPEDFKEKMMKDFPEIYKEFVILQSYVEKVALLKNINKDPGDNKEIKNRL